MTDNHAGIIIPQMGKKVNMGYEAVQFFRELMDECNEEKENLRNIRSDVERLTLKLISEINLVNEDDREEIAEEFKAIMEDYFGLEETV